MKIKNNNQDTALTVLKTTGTPDEIPDYSENFARAGERRYDVVFKIELDKYDNETVWLSYRLQIKNKTRFNTCLQRAITEMRKHRIFRKIVFYQRRNIDILWLDWVCVTAQGITSDYCLTTLDIIEEYEPLEKALKQLKNCLYLR